MKEKQITKKEFLRELKKHGLTLGKDVFLMDTDMYFDFITKGKCEKFIPFKDNKDEK